MADSNIYVDGYCACDQPEFNDFNVSDATSRTFENSAIMQLIAYSVQDKFLADNTNISYLPFEGFEKSPKKTSENTDYMDMDYMDTTNFVNSTDTNENSIINENLDIFTELDLDPDLESTSNPESELTNNIFIGLKSCTLI